MLFRSDAEQGRAAASPVPLPPGACTLLFSGELHADGKSSLSVSPYQHDEEEGRRGTTKSTPPHAGEGEVDPRLLHLQNNRPPSTHDEAGANHAVTEKRAGDKNSTVRPPPPARRPHPETAQTSGSTDPRPPKNGRATARTQRSSTQKGKLAASTHHSDSAATSTTPPAGDLQIGRAHV